MVLTSGNIWLTGLLPTGEPMNIYTYYAIDMETLEDVHSLPFTAVNDTAALEMANAMAGEQFFVVYINENSLTPDELARFYVECVEYGNGKALQDAAIAERIGKALPNWAELVYRAKVDFYYN